jgi:hypothetical protein
MLASLIFDAVLSIPAEQVFRRIYCLLSSVFAAPSTVYCMLSTVFTIPAIAEMIEGTLDRVRKCSEQNNLNIDANHVAPTFRSAHAGLKAGATTKECFNIVGRGYPPPKPHLPLVHAADEDRSGQ